MQTEKRVRKKRENKRTMLKTDTASEEELKVVHLFMKKVSVSSFSLQDTSVVLSIEFNDGNKKEIYRSTVIKNPDKLTDEILKEIITLEENVNKEFDGEELVGSVNVIFHHYDSVQNRLIQFLREVQSRLLAVKNLNKATGYVRALQKLQSTEMTFFE